MSDFNYSNIETAYEKIKHLLVKTPLISNDLDLNDFENLNELFQSETTQLNRLHRSRFKFLVSKLGR